MSEYSLTILTPEKEAFSGMVEAAVCPTIDGNIEILNGHQNLVAALEDKEIRIKFKNEWITFSIEDGFAEVRPDGVVIFVTYCEKITE